MKYSHFEIINNIFLSAQRENEEFLICIQQVLIYVDQLRVVYERKRVFVLKPDTYGHFPLGYFTPKSYFKKKFITLTFSFYKIVGWDSNLKLIIKNYFIFKYKLK